MSNTALYYPSNVLSTQLRKIVFRTRGRTHGPITRLMSPSDLGQRIKPFVFLDHVNVDGKNAPRFGFHPHSGIATLTLLLEGNFGYEDSTGETGLMGEGSVEWMQAGGGVWHKGSGTGEQIKGYQLWVVLPPELENAPPQSRYLGPEHFSSEGPARVILGELGSARSPIPSPSPMNYLDVNLEPGQVWEYHPPAGHDVAWLAMHEGKLVSPDSIERGEMVVFEDGQTNIRFKSEGKTSFVLGSAAKHPHDLVMGDYSVHTSHEALQKGAAGINRIAEELQRKGKL